MPRESKADKAKRTAKILGALKKEYPGAQTALNFSNPLELLVATVLSAQCTDVKVNQITPELFEKYRTAEDYANADDQLERIIRPTGFYRNKARSIRKAARTIADEHDGKVPQTMKELVALPGVARKTANIVLGSAFGKNEGMAVDRHVQRVARRLKLTYRKNNQGDRMEKDLCELVPRKEWTFFGHALVLHGRRYCTARNPKCDECPLAKLCPSAGKV
ncbi:MAG: endonuclease III [Phycisphaerae bacterium]